MRLAKLLSMLPISRPAARLFLWLLVLAPPWATAEPLTVLDISQASAEDVEWLKQRPGAAWWLEMGTQMVVVGEDPAVAREAASARVVAVYDEVDPQRLLLRARGCGEHSTERGSVLGRGGRWELRQVAAHEVQVLLRDDPDGWQPVSPNTTLARQLRLDPQATAADADPRVQQVVDRIDPVRWFADVQTLSSWDRSSYGGASLEAARDWIAAQFSALGLEVHLAPFTMNASGGGTIVRHNVVGVWTGSSRADRLAIVGAHYDARNASIASTVGVPGAEDNASGCAGVIELARALLPSQPSPSIAFMCYAGEEQGLRGSTAHVQALVQSGDLARVDLVAIMDMIGYSADADLEALFESSAAHSDYLAHFGAAAATYAPELAAIASTLPFGSDHVPYINAGLRAALSIENDWDIYPHYHRSSDTPANLGPHALAMGAAILKTNAAVVAELGGLSPELFGDGFEAR